MGEEGEIMWIGIGDAVQRRECVLIIRLNTMCEIVSKTLIGLRADNYCWVNNIIILHLPDTYNTDSEPFPVQWLNDKYANLFPHPTQNQIGMHVAIYFTTA